jgi:hypothetical protein
MKLGLSKSYVKDALARAEKLPPIFRDFARGTQATFSPHRTGPRKKRLNPRKNNDKSPPPKP